MAKITKGMIEDWRSWQDALQEAKKKEMELRIKICEALASDKDEGTHKFDIGNIKVKVAKKNNYKIDREQYALLCEAFTEEEKECVRLIPEVNMKDYRAYIKQSETDDEINLDNLNECITVTPATPTLEIIE